MGVSRWKITEGKFSREGDSGKTDLTGFLLKAAPSDWIPRVWDAEVDQILREGWRFWLDGLNMTLARTGLYKEGHRSSGFERELR